MIIKGPLDVSPIISVSLDGVPVDYLSTMRMSVEMCENLHNMAIIEFAGLSPQLIHTYVGVPVYVSMSIRSREDMEFYGYVSHLEPLSVTQSGTVNDSPFQITRVYCLGTSYVMKSKNTQVWENNTIAEIASELANRYKLSVSVPNNPYRFPRLVQSGQSDWAFLVQTANHLGYNVLMDKTNIHIWDPFKAISRRVSYSALYTLSGTKGDPSPQPGQIIKFEGRVGSVTTSGARTPDTVHILDNQGTIISVTTDMSTDQSGLGVPVDPLFSNQVPYNAETYGMAEQKITGLLRQKFPLHASVQVVGDTSLKPGGIVYINKYNSQFDGFWYIQSVRHDVAQSSMVSHLELAKDALGDNTQVPLTVSSYSIPPEPALLNKQWVSGQDTVDIYV